MCIICNTKQSGNLFLSSFDESRHKMKNACDYILKCSEECGDGEIKEHYKKIHKKMVRITKEWNSIEQERELK